MLEGGCHAPIAVTTSLLCPSKGNENETELEQKESIRGPSCGEEQLIVTAAVLSLDGKQLVKVCRSVVSTVSRSVYTTYL